MNYDSDINTLLLTAGYTVFNTKAKQGQAAPFVVFSIVTSFENDTTKDSKAQNETIRIQVAVYALNIATRNIIAQAVKEAMEFKSQGALKHIEYDGFTDFFEPETDVYQRNIEFIINCKIN